MDEMVFVWIEKHNEIARSTPLGCRTCSVLLYGTTLCIGIGEGIYVKEKLIIASLRPSGRQVLRAWHLDMQSDINCA